MPLNPDTKREVARKVLHMSMGLFALCLRWLTPWQAALCALAALLHNLFLFPHYGMKKLERPEEKARGYSGMVGYPAVVLLLMLLSWKPFHHMGIGISPDDPVWNPLNLAPAAGAWAILAFGDAFGALCGLFVGGPTLPWNPKKRWSGWAAFVVFGTLFGTLWFNFVADGSAFGLGWEVAANVLLAAVLAGLVETLPGQLDDNLTVPLAAWLVLTFTWGSPGWWESFGRDGGGGWPSFSLAGLLAINLAMGLLSWRLRWVNAPSCALGILFGSIVLLGSGGFGYLFLLAFYVVSQLSTFVGKKTKEARGIAEADGGRRSMGSVFSKGLVPAFFALVSPSAMIAALGVYAADTVASEIGKTSGGKAISLRGFRVVPAGTVGAVSLRGTLAGLAAVALFAFLFWWVGQSPGGEGFFGKDAWVASRTDLVRLEPRSTEFLLLLACTTAAMVVAFFAESLLNELVVARGYFSKEMGHLFLGGFAGALSHGLLLVFYGVLVYWGSDFASWQTLAPEGGP